jgi:glyoxylase-like metal-dependent hydrolase (beta-lactamase superfamily II)
MRGMEKIMDGVYRLGTRWVNFYLVVEGDGLTLIDTGLPKYVPQFEDALRELGRATSNLRAIVLTHTHIDHIGAADKFHELNDVPVFVHSGESAIATGDAKPGTPSGALGSLWRPSMLSFAAHFLTNGGAKKVTVPSVQSYEHDEVLDVPGKPRVVFCPGHSPAHSALLLEDRGVLFCGDAMGTLAVNTGETGAMVHPMNEDRARAIEALDALEGISAEMVLPGHGEPYRGTPAEAVSAARARL